MLPRILFAAGLADRCEIQLSYAIGIAKPIAIFIDTFGTGKISEDEIIKRVQQTFDLSPMALSKCLTCFTLFIVKLRHMVTLAAKIYM